MTKEPDNPRPTLTTIAKMLGVSRATVSNAYNHPDQLSPALRQRVMKAADQIGYSGPNPAAATLRGSKVGVIGVFFEDPATYAFTDPAETGFVSGIAKVCDNHDVGILISPGDQASSLMNRALIDGCIMHIDRKCDPRLATALRRDIPLVLVDGNGESMTSVGIDDRSAAASAARHLRELGHQSVGIITTNLGFTSRLAWIQSADDVETDYDVARFRLAGYLEGLHSPTNASHEAVPVVLSSGPDPREAGARGLQLLMSQTSSNVTAVLCMSDEIAAGAFEEARELGLDIPRDLSIVGFDDTSTAESLGLSSVHQDHQRKGELAATFLLTGQHDTGGRTDLPTYLIPRKSTGPCPTGHR
ncbi:MAG: transcriptional regulator [Brachybacterium faecium]|nr:MAG: transcriptional regulator [Brachybacterium faecium]